MPAKNSVKIYVEGGYYHIYNRGVEKRDIFVDGDDYRAFLFLLKFYLSPKDLLNKLPKRSDLKTGYYNKKNLHGMIELLAYCLMPNHFHLLVKQKMRSGISNLIQCLNTSYVIYFNKKYERVGTLFTGRFKAALIESDPYLLHLSRYIHLNPSGIGKDFKSWGFSSYQDYLGRRKTEWVNSQAILDYFASARRRDFKDYSSYQSFVEDYRKDSEEILDDLVIETSR